MQAAVMSYCLQGALPKDGRTMEKIIELAASEQILAVEVYAGAWQIKGDIRQDAEALKVVADGLGVSVPVMGSGTRFGHIDASKDEYLTTLKSEIEACAILGGKVLTLPAVDGQPVPIDNDRAIVGVRFEQMLPELVAQLQELADHAEQFDVELAVLNHCFLVYLGWHQKWLSVLCEKNNVGACVDPGNYLHYGHQEPESVCRELASVAKMVRAGNVKPTPESDVLDAFKKNGQFSPWQATPFDEGVINQVACYQALADGGFDGVVSLKTAGTHLDGPLEAVRYSWRALNAALEQVT